MAYLRAVLVKDGCDAVVAADIDPDGVHDLEARVLTHGLDLGDKLPDEALLDKLWGEVGVEHHGHAAAALGSEAVLLNCLDEQILRRKRDFIAVNGEADSAV